MQKYIYCVEKALCSSAAIYSCIYCIFISCKYRPHMERISCFESILHIQIKSVKLDELYWGQIVCKIIIFLSIQLLYFYSVST